MQSRYYRIQHLLTALRVLEVAARKGSFTKAGEELGLSQPTVSRHILNLEEDVGTILFERDHNKLSLTEEGQRLSDSVALGLSHIDRAVRTIAAKSDRLGLTLACTHSFAHGWLLPRFSSLRHAAGQPINLNVSYWLEDVNPDEVDMIISWRTLGWAGWPRISLFDEIAYPVCSTAFLNKHPNLQLCDSSPEDLSSAPLLNYVERDSDYVGWESWFSSFDTVFVQPEDVYRFSNYHFMIQAAMDGEGIALGWHHLVADQINSGRLVRVGPIYRHRLAAYALEYRDEANLKERISSTLEWFRNEAAKTQSSLN